MSETQAEGPSPIIAKPMIVGQPVLIVVDISKGSFMERPKTSRLDFMADAVDRYQRARDVVAAARKADVPVVFVKEVHRENLIDFGRELDGKESIHCIETRPGSEYAFEEFDMRPDDYKIAKRRYSVFFGTDMEILLRGLKAETLIMVGGFTDVCVHYSFVDAHQNDYYCRVVSDCVSGSSQEAHDASLKAMEYLQAGALRSSDEIIAAFEERKAAKIG